eukprot:NODE_8_length_47770_cov_0.334354.p10 type:complete len:332 gc:universal NODE_8_length_47770_cov_0.334354:26461-25466(-)
MAFATDRRLSPQEWEREVAARHLNDRSLPNHVQESLNNLDENRGQETNVPEPISVQFMNKSELFIILLCLFMYPASHSFYNEIIEEVQVQLNIKWTYFICETLEWPWERCTRESNALREIVTVIKDLGKPLPTTESVRLASNGISDVGAIISRYNLQADINKLDSIKQKLKNLKSATIKAIKFQQLFFCDVEELANTYTLEKNLNSLTHLSTRTQKELESHILKELVSTVNNQLEDAMDDIEKFRYSLVKGKGSNPCDKWFPDIAECEIHKSIKTAEGHILDVREVFGIMQDMYLEEKIHLETSSFIFYRKPKDDMKYINEIVQTKVCKSF